MAEVFIPGPVSGRNYGFVISGDNPTVDEQMRIDAAIRQQEDQFAEEYEAQYGERPGGAEAGFFDYLGEFPKGLARGAVGLGESAALGIAGLLPEEYETPTREAIRGAAYGLKPEVDIGLEETVSGKFGEAVGSFVPLLATSALPGGLALSGTLAVGAGAGEASERARAAGATVEERNQSLLPGAAVGALELIPIKFMKALGRNDTLSVAKRIARIGESAGVEGAQEAAAEVAQNLISKNIYDPEKGVFTDTGESLGYGAGVGALVQGIMDLAIPGKPRTSTVASQTDEPLPTEETVDAESFEMPDPRQPITADTMDRLGVPPGAPVRRRIESGEIDSGLGAVDALEEYADAAERSPGTADLAPRIRDFVSSAREVRLSDVQPELELGRDELSRTGDGVQSVEQTGPDTAPEGTGTLDADGLGVPESRVGATPAPEVEQQPALRDADAPGFETSREPELDIRPPATTAAPTVEPLPTEAEAFEQAAIDTPRVVPTDPPKQAASREGETVPPAPSEAEARAAVGQYMQDNPDISPTEVEIDEIVADLTRNVKTVDEAAADVLARSETAGRTEPAPDVEAEPEMVPGLEPLGETDVQPQQGIVPEDIESRAALLPETEPEAAPAPIVEPVSPIEPELAPAPTVETVAPQSLTTAETERNAIPGRPTGAAGQVIPEGIAPEPGREPAVQPTTEGETEINAAVNAARMRKGQQERAEDAQVAAEISRAYAENTSADLQEFAKQEISPDPDRDITSVADKQKVLALLNKTFTSREKKLTNPEWAARLYFSKHPDVMTSIDTIAYDAVASPVDVANTTKDMSAGAKEYYQNTGRRWGTSAGKWVLDNLDRDARLQVYERIDFYRPQANEAVQNNIMDNRDSAVERDRKYREYIGDQTGEYVGVTPDFETAQELGFGTEDVTDVEGMFSKTTALDMPLHPQVVRAIEAGDVNAVLDGLIATSGSRDAALLSAKLRPFVQDTPIRLFDPQLMADMNEVFGDGKRDPALGIYMPRYTPKELAQRNAEDTNSQRAQLRTDYNGVVAINSETGLTPSTVLHELIHVATTKRMLNASHPLTRQIETMLAEARKIMPQNTYGLLNRYEFVAEGMTNPDFIQELSQVDTGLGAQKFTLFERFRHALRNFVRQMMGKKAKPLRIQADNQKDALDLMIDDLLATDRNMRGVGTLYNKLFQKNGARDIMNSMKSRTVEATPTNMKQFRKLARSTMQRVPFGDKAKDFVIRASMPLMFVVENAKRAGLPSAPEMYETVNAHGSEVHRMSVRVEETLMPIRDFLKKNKDKVDLFNRARFRSTEARVDPRKPRSAYETFQLAYDEVDADGDFVRRVTKSYKTEDAMSKDRQRLNADPTAQRVKMTQDPTSETGIERLAAYDEVSALYRDLGQEGRAALNRAFELPEYFRNEMKRVAKARLEAMLPGQRATQERIYKNVFEKIFAETLIDPYQALQRRGSFGLSYTARDPDSGDLKVFKHAFESTKLRDQAISLLNSLGPEAEVSQVLPYDMDKSGFQQQRPSMQFISSVLTTLESNGELGTAGKVDEILELVFESTPETSFVRAYQNRKDVPGYTGDITPLGFDMNMGDTMDNIRSNGMHLASKVADTEYQVKLDNLRKRLAEEKDAFTQQAALLPVDERAAATEEASTYAKVLDDFSRAPFRQRANWSRTLTAGGYALTLGFNVSTAAITFFQMPTIIYPYLAGKYGGRKSMQSIGEATRILTSSGMERTIERVSPEGGLESVRRKVGFYDFSVSNLDFEDTKNAYLKDLFEVADTAGVFNRSLTQDILDETGAKGWVQKIAAYSGLMQHHTERYMRESTLLATYLMELHKRLPEGQAVDFKRFLKGMRDGTIEVPAEIGQAAAKDAVYTSDMTNGSILAAAAPEISQGDIGSVIYLFKRFPLAMLNMLWHTAKRAGDAQNNPEDRRIAAMQFGGMAGSLTLLAGASGIPGFHMASALWNLIKDEEDDDLETLIRTGVLGEVGLTGLVDYYAGVSVSSRIGLSGTFYRPGFNTEDQKPLLTLLEGFGGPVVGLFNKYTDRVPYFFQEGEYQRMTEALMPTSIGNAMKSFRFATEGARTLRYDPILDDVGPFAAGAQFFGFMPTEYARQLAQNSRFREVDSGINKTRSKLMRKVYLARRMRDSTGLRDSMADIREFNRRYPHAAIDQETLAKSLKSHETTTSRMHHGVSFSRKNEPYIKRDARDWDSPTVWSD